MSASLHYTAIDNSVAKLSKIQEFIDIGVSSNLDIALDIEESNSAEKSSEEVDKLKDLTIEYVKMEKELKQWLKAAELTKTAFTMENNKEGGNNQVPDIESIFMSKLSEIEKTLEANELQQHPKVMQFTQQVWNVHHSGQPLPNALNDENMDEDIIIAQAPEESITCPITRKQMIEPVRSKKCNHSYEKTAIMQHIQMRHRAHCPVAGCANFVTQRDLEPNNELAFRIKRLQRKK